MSTARQAAPIKVLARDFRDRAQIVWFVKECNGKYQISSEDGTAVMNVPRTDIYEFDESLRLEVNAAQSERHLLWSKATGFHP